MYDDSAGSLRFLQLLFPPGRVEKEAAKAKTP
jgi:hypothetical protein